jgi:hypothetical protein
MDHPRAGGWPQRQHAVRTPHGTTVSRYAGQPGSPRSGGRRALSTGLCIFLLTAGAIFWFALPAGSHLGINLHVVGIIVVCAGLLGLVLRRLPGMPASRDLLSRLVIPRRTTGPGEGPAGEHQYSEDDNQPMVANLSAESGRPTLADVLLNAEKDPPL